MPRFRTKPEIVDAIELAGLDLWVVKKKDGTETQYLGNTFRRLYERVSDTFDVTPPDPVWDGRERRAGLQNVRCPHCTAYISRLCLICPICKQGV